MDEVGVPISAVREVGPNGMYPFPFDSLALVCSRERWGALIGNGR